jgi:hypothetical protein
MSTPNRSAPAICCSRRRELIIPTGEIKTLELTFFSEIEEKSIHELLKQNAIFRLGFLPALTGHGVAFPIIGPIILN